MDRERRQHKEYQKADDFSLHTLTHINKIKKRKPSEKDLPFLKK